MDMCKTTAVVHQFIRDGGLAQRLSSMQHSSYPGCGVQNERQIVLHTSCTFCCPRTVERSRSSAKGFGADARASLETWSSRSENEERVEWRHSISYSKDSLSIRFPGHVSVVFCLPLGLSPAFHCFHTLDRTCAHVFSLPISCGKKRLRQA